MLNQNGKLNNPEVRIETTNRCNLDCTVCAHSEMTRPQGTMTTEFFANLLCQAKELGAILISPFGFGEPFLDKELADKIKICTELGLDTFITTNGILCSEDRIYHVLEAGLGHIRFSIHGLDEKVRMVDFGMLTNIIETIDMRDGGLWEERLLSMTCMPANDMDIEDLIRWEKIGIDWLEIWRPHNWATKKQYRQQTKEKKHCNRPVKGPLQIQWDGKVIPCCFITDAELVLGDAHKQTLKDILEGEAYYELRARHETGDLEGLPCENCDQRNIERESPLLYSSRDPNKAINTTSSLKFNLEE